MLLITEPQLICDHCDEPIEHGAYVAFVYQGYYDGLIDNKPYLQGEDNEFHFHITCYDEASKKLMAVVREREDVPSI